MGSEQQSQADGADWGRHPGRGSRSPHVGHAAPGTCVHEAGAHRPPVFTRPFFPRAKVADALTGRPLWVRGRCGSESAAHGGGRGATASPAIYADDFEYVHFNADFFFLKKRDLLKSSYF